MKRFYHMRALLLAATAALALTPPAYAQVIGTGNSFDAGRDQIGIVRDGTFEGYATPASLLTWVQTNITFPPDRYPTSASLVGTTLQIGMSLGPTLAVDLSSLEESAAVNAVQAALNAHIAADLDTDPTNERGVLGNGTNGNITYQPYPGAPVATVVQPSETVTGTAAANTLARGLSLGSVNKPLGAPATWADVTTAPPELDVAYSSMGALFTNRATELGSAGMMNVDGSLGHYSRTLSTNVANFDTDVQTALNYNGAHLSVSFVTGDTITMPPARYGGQLLTLRFNGPLSAELVMDVNGLVNYAGMARGSDHKIDPTSPTDNGYYIYRAAETVQLVSVGTQGWMIIDTSFELWDQPNWQENEDGTVKIWYHSSLTVADGVFQATPIPVQIAPPTSVVASVVDRAVGSGSSSDAVSLYSYDRDNSTSSTFLVMRRFAGIAGTVRPAADSVSIILTNAKLDYAALGGVASF